MNFRATKPQLHQALLDVIPMVGRYYDLRQRGVQSASRLRDLLGVMYVAPQARPRLDEVVFVVANATHALTHEGLLKRPEGFDDARLAREITRMVCGYLRAISDAP